MNKYKKEMKEICLEMGIKYSDSFDKLDWMQLKKINKAHKELLKKEKRMRTSFCKRTSKRTSKGRVTLTKNEWINLGKTAGWIGNDFKLPERNGSEPKSEEIDQNDLKS